MFFNGLLGFFNKVFFFTSYVGTDGSFPKPLSKEEEAICIEKAKNGDELAKETLIRHNLRLVAHIVKKYANQGEVDDLISIGSIGLIKGINTYEYGRGTVLATYIARCVENEILMHLRATKKLKNNVSIYEHIGRDKDGNELEIVDLLFEEEDSVFRKVDIDIQRQRLLEILKKSLDKREFQIICMRYGLNGQYQKTQRETAEILGISRSYISRIEKKAMLKLREKLIKEKYNF
ncbi:MAG: RNA polymerase sporulation sigma factor SigK [Clostridia bacterium]